MTAGCILYGAAHSYSTGKARSYMRFKGLDREERTATREVCKSIILPGIGAPSVPCAQYHALQGVDREAADDLLRDIGGLEALNCAISHWVARKPGQLELVEGSR